MASDEKSDDSHSDHVNEESSPPGIDLVRALNGVDLFPPHVDHQTRLNWSAVQRPVFVVGRPFRAYPPRSSEANVNDQALWDIPPPEDLSHHFSAADLEREIEAKYLSFAANACNDQSNYRRLVRKLKLDQSSLWRLERDYGGHVREYVYRVLLTWKRRHPEARVRELVKILSESKLPDSAVELKKFFSSIDWRD